MYKLMLVDDEEEVRKGIMEEIAWEDFGFTVIGEAENGKDAVELAETVIPDIVITDIKMPFMDGLELSKRLKDLHPAIKILILTGFDEFEFAQQAIKLHVDEYVLKPVLVDDLAGVLSKIKKKLDEEYAQREDINALKDRFRRSLPILRGKFLTSLVTNKMNHNEIEEKARNYDLDLAGHCFIVSVISIDNNTLQSEEVKGSGLKYSADTELKLFAVFNIAEEIAARYGLGIIFTNTDNIVIISKGSEAQKGILANQTLQVLEEILFNIEKYLKFTVTAGKGTICRDITDIKNSYGDALLALDYRLILGNSRVICIEDVENHTSEKIGFDEIKEQSLIRCVKVGTVSEIKDIIGALFSDFENTKISIKNYQVYLLELLTTILKATKGTDVDLDSVFQTNSMLNEILTFNNIFEAKEWFKGLCIRIMENISYDRQNSCNSIVEKAKEFINNHYHESDLTLNKVADFLHISSGYFSSIFKKETKMTFINYLLQVRMEAAKELLRTTYLMAFEIAEKVGFSEPYYFSYCFKKHLGITPKQYRNSSRIE